MKVAIDRSRYFVVPRTSARRHLTLGRLLDKRKPKQASVDLEAAAKVMNQAVFDLTSAYVERHLEHSQASPAEEVEFDLYTDQLWAVIDSRLDHWEVFQRPAGVRLAAHQSPGGFDYVACVDEAKQAERVRELLFGLRGVDFTRLKYVEQAEYMTTLWQVIEQEELGEALVEFVGAKFYGALRDGQPRYLEMIEQRSARERGSNVNLRELALELQQAIQNYLIALLAGIRDDDSENVAIHRHALQPVDALRAQLERERGRVARGGDEDEDGGELEEAALADFLAEEQALEQELGLGVEDELGPESAAAEE
jgi:hypothetical protein